MMFGASAFEAVAVSEYGSADASKRPFQRNFTDLRFMLGAILFT
jgi:hypothetical protein